MARDLQDNEALFYGLAGGAMLLTGLVSTSALIKLGAFGAAGWLFYEAASRMDAVDTEEETNRAPAATARNGQRDKVDQASWESFPASDPPAY